MNVNSLGTNQRQAQSVAMAVYAKYRAKFDVKESEQKTVDILIRDLHITEDFAKEVVKQLWN